MKKQPSLLLGIGSLLMAIGFLTAHFVSFPESVADFVKGLGVGLMITSVFVQRKLAKKMGSKL